MNDAGQMGRSTCVLPPERPLKHLQRRGPPASVSPQSCGMPSSPPISPRLLASALQGSSPGHPP